MILLYVEKGQTVSRTVTIEYVNS